MARPYEYEVILSEDELRQLCTEYQEILRLQDWRNKIRIMRGYEFDNEDAEGQVKYTLSRKEALIYILDHVDYEPTQAFPQDMEVTLVHELIHLHFAEISDRCEKAEVDITIPLEQAIQCLAEAIVSLRRATRKE